jgi:hypothetical protein
MAKFVFGTGRARFDRALVEAGIIPPDEQNVHAVEFVLNVGEPARVLIHKFLDEDQVDALADAMLASRPTPDEEDRPPAQRPRFGWREENEPPRMQA